MLTNSSGTDLESFFWRKVAAVSPDSARPDTSYENGWNALSQAVHEKYSEAGRQPNVFYIRRGGQHYDFSGISGLDCAEDSRTFAVTDIDGDGNLDLVLKSRLGPQVRVFQNNCAKARNSVAFRLRGVTSNRDAIGARVEVNGQAKFVSAGSGYLSQHTKTMHFGLGDQTKAAVRITWPSGQQSEFRELAAGSFYEIEEGSPHYRSSSFATPVEMPSRGVAVSNDPSPGDTWLLKPILLPEDTPGPAFLRLSHLSPERATLYAVFCRYLFDLRIDLKLPVWFLVDDRSRAHKIYFSAPDPADLNRLTAPRLPLAVPGTGVFYSEPERNYAALGAAFFAAALFAAAGLPEEDARLIGTLPSAPPLPVASTGPIVSRLSDCRKAGSW